MIAPDLNAVALLGVLDDVLGIQIDQFDADKDGRPLWRWQCVAADHRHVSREAWHTPAAALRVALAARFGLLRVDGPARSS